MGTKNADMRLIKWEIVWKNNKEEKNRERETSDICYNCEQNC